MRADPRDTFYTYSGKVELRDGQGRLTVFDVAGGLYARTREEAAHQVAVKLQQDASTSSPLGDDDRPPGAR